MSLICSLSNEVPEQPVISPASGHIFERRLIEKYLATYGYDPINHEPLAPEQLIDVKTTAFVKPKPPSATSIPAILKALQDEWDAVMMHSFTLRQQQQTARQELSHALYQHDAACRVIARLTKEVTAAREALATLKPQAGMIAAGGNQAQPVLDQTAVEQAAGATAPNQLMEEVGMSDDIVSRLQEKASLLTADRKRRGKTIPEGVPDSNAMSEYHQVASHVGLHSASVPGILCLDTCLHDPRRVLTGGNDKNAVVFNLESAQVVSILRGHSRKVTCSVYHPQENIALTGSPDSTIRIWGVDQAHCASILRPHAGAITGLSIHATGDFVLSSSADAHWAFSDLRVGKMFVRVIASDKSGNPQPLTCAQFHPDGLILGTGTEDSEVKIWDLKEGKNVATFPHSTSGDPIKCLSFSENGYYLATGAEDGQVKLWDLRKLKNFKTLTPGEDRQHYEIQDLVFDHSGSYLAVAGSDVRVYLVKQWSQLSVFNEHTAMATGIRFGHNASSIVSVSMDRSVKVFGP